MNQESSIEETYLFLKPAFAQTEMAFLEEEAGMSIYIKIDGPVNLAVVKTVFRTIETETPDYVIRSVELPDPPASKDVHCFVNNDGWAVIYYIKTEPITS